MAAIEAWAKAGEDRADLDRVSVRGIAIGDEPAIIIDDILRIGCTTYV